ncbi:hypothetical protein [Alicyclobacillus shizuokensis]|uniref:hypothetical protein n=1 Tax=Alicyclobacillus shizuokensis TaxID=392014 RepID=UPI00082AB485|nr:hypothetical protein [Alicyclobacillus shizuokensis]
MNTKFTLKGLHIDLPRVSVLSQNPSTVKIDELTIEVSDLQMKEYASAVVDVMQGFGQLYRVIFLDEESHAGSYPPPPNPFPTSPIR